MELPKLPDDLEATIEVMNTQELKAFIQEYARQAVLIERKACEDICKNADYDEMGTYYCALKISERT